MMLFIFGYLLPLLIMTVVFTCFMFEDFRNKSPDITYGALAVSAATILIPVVNIVAVVSCIFGGLSYIWDECSDRSIFKK